MNRNVKWGTRAAVAVGTLALVIGAGVGTANARCTRPRKPLKQVA